MCNNTFNIKVVEGNAFPLIVRLQALSYEAVPPIAEPIDYTRLTDCVLKVGSVEYEVEITEDGVRAIMPATLALGDYNVVFTAKYEGSDIRAAYLRAITIVKWNEQSNAGECLLGSPVVLPAAVVIGGTLTDAELEELKEEMREKNVQLAQAIEDAEVAKAEWERKAAELDDVAQETTLVQGVEDIREDIAAIDIDTSDLAKQGTNPNATMSEVQSLLQEIKDSHIIRGLSVDGIIYDDGFVPQNVVDVLLNMLRIVRIYDDTIETASSIPSSGSIINLQALKYIVTTQSISTVLSSRSTLVELHMPSLRIVEASQDYYNIASACSNLRVLNVELFTTYVQNPTQFPFLQGSPSCIEVHTGANFQGNMNMSSWNSANAVLTNSVSLLTQEDIQAGFTSNCEKLLWNIREYIVKELPDRSGEVSYTITLGSRIKNAILNEANQATANAFANKNWIIA